MGMKPSYKELEVKLKATKAELDATKKELKVTGEQLKQTQELLKNALERILVLEEKLNLNSNNSSKPPSSDQKGDTSDKGKKKRKGRRGVNRSLFPPERIDRRVECTQESCPHCGSCSIELNKNAHEILQQAELPEVRAIITEYLMRKYSCNCCGQNSTATLPKGIPNSAFGPKLMGLFTTLTGLFHLAKREGIALIKDLYDVDIALGSASNIEERVTHALDPIYERINDFVITSRFCKHFDETGWRNSGQRHYVWLASCEHAAYYMIERRRNAAAFKKLVRTDPSALAAVTDRYAVYNVIQQSHQYCLAHLIRDFRKYGERSGLDGEIGGALAKELKKACWTHGKYRDGKISWDVRNRRLRHRKHKVKDWLEDGVANGSDQLCQLCETLLDHFENLWTFTKVQGMEPTNNLAERDMRKLVIWRKKSYGTRSDRGKRFVERITTVSQTLRRQGQNVLKFVQEAIVMFYRNEDAPLISKTLGF